MITKPLFFVLRIIPVIFLIIIIISFINITISEIGKKEAERFVIELAENIIQSDLTVERGVFKISELEKYDNTLKEPYVRHCKFAYYLSVDDLKDKKAWRFGYSPRYMEEEIEEEIGVAVKEIPVYLDNGNPARLRLVVYDSWFTRTTCLIENAYNSKQTQNMTIPWKYVRPIRNSDDNQICTYGKTIDGKKYDRICRYLEIPIQFIDPGTMSGDVIMKAIPVKKGISLPSEGDCSSISDDMIAKKDDAIIVICMEEKE